MSLTNLSKVTTSGIATGTSLLITNVSSSGVVTASSFSGPLSGDATGLSGTPNITVGVVTASSVTISGDLTVEGSYSTLDTIVTEVDKLEVAANNNTVGVAITQSGTGDILNLFDGSTEVFTVLDGGNVGIGLTNPTSKVHVYGNGAEVFVKQDSTLPGSAGFKVFAAGVDSPNNASYYTMNAGSIWGQTGGDGIYFGPENRSSVQLHIKTSNGNVGIGTDNPSSKLHLTNGDLRVENTFGFGATFSNTSTTGMYITLADTGSSAGVGCDNGALTLRAGGNTNEKVRITSTGNVGIGTDNPTKNLTITGNNPGILLKEDSANSELLLTINDSDGTGVIAASRPSNFTYEQLAIRGQDLIFETTSTQSRVERLRITSTGLVGIGTHSPTADLEIEKPTSASLEVGNTLGQRVRIEGGSSGISFSTPNVLNMTFGTSNTERLRITSSGNVGIGTTNPDKKLRVEGDARITGTLTMGTASVSIDGTVEYPSIRPTLDLNFAATKVLDDIITFTRDSIGTYTDELGVLKYASNNVPRFDHDPATGESLGLLIEESRTNLVNYSEEFTNSFWTKHDCSLSQTASAPDGTNNATIVTRNSTSYGSVFVIRYSQSVTSGQTYTLSWFIKAGTYTGDVRLDLDSSGTGGYPISPNDVTFNISNGTRTGGATSGYTVTQYPDGWYRYTMTGTASANGSLEYSITTSSPALNEYFYIWGAQLELGSFATSYIPTSGSTVTRAVDSAKITGTNFTDFYNSKEFTLYGDGRSITGTSNIGGSAALVSIDNNTNNYRFILRRSNGSNQALPSPGYSGFTFRYYKSDDSLNMDAFPPSYSGSSQYDATGVIPSYWTDTSLHKMLMATNNSDISQLAGYADGYSANFANTGNSFTGTETLTPYTQATQMRIGFGGSSKYWNGQISSIKYYPKRLPNAQLQGLTQQ